ncbi:MAG: twin-arginine translocase TatA/TatE family subunit [Thermoleophilaceae bacterium]
MSRTTPSRARTKPQHSFGASSRAWATRASCWLAVMRTLTGYASPAVIQRGAVARIGGHGPSHRPARNPAGDGQDPARWRDASITASWRTRWRSCPPTASLIAMGFGPSPMELMVIAVIALIVLGPSRLPEAARSLGKGMREMRDSFSGKGDDDVAGRLSARDDYEDEDYDEDEDEDKDDVDVAASSGDDETVVKERAKAEKSSTSAGSTA